MMRQTVQELTPAIGAVVLVRYQEIVVECRVRDAKASYGKVRLLVHPIAGRGCQWIELSRLVVESAADQEDVIEQARRLR